MARTDIARVVARAVLEDILDPADGTVDDSTNHLLRSAITVKRRRMQNIGEVIEIVWAVPPDPTTPEE